MVLLDLQGMEAAPQTGAGGGKSNLSVTLCGGTSHLSVLLCQ